MKIFTTVIYQKLEGNVEMLIDFLLYHAFLQFYTEPNGHMSFAYVFLPDMSMRLFVSRTTIPSSGNVDQLIPLNIRGKKLSQSP